MKTTKEYAEAAAARLKKLKNGSTPQENAKLKSPKPQGRVQKPIVRKPTGRGK